jgi:uncharacterized protein
VTLNTPEFEWDQQKRTTNIEKHKVDFLIAAQIFDGKVVTRIDDRFDYGEVRWIAIGLHNDECFVVVYVKRGTKIRLITAWKGGESEREIYESGIS